MPQVELSAGTIEYEDTGGEGPVVVLLHGLAMNSSVWHQVLPDLRTDYRCVLPTLPLGGHRTPMRPDADLSLRGLVRLVAEFLETLGLRDVTLVAHSMGGGELARYIGRHGTGRVRSAVLLSAITPLMLQGPDNPEGVPRSVFDDIKAGILK